MSSARFTVRFTGPLVTFQDAGRPGHKRFGVSASGPRQCSSIFAGSIPSLPICLPRVSDNRWQ